MPVELIPQLAVTYGACLLIFALIAAVLYALDRSVLWKRLLILWLAASAVLVVEGLAQYLGLTAVALASALNIAFTVPLARVLQPVTGAVAWKWSDGVLLLAGLLVGGAAASAGAPFWIIALVQVPAIVAPLLRTLRGFHRRWVELSAVDRMLAVSILLLVLHKVDYAFLRPVESAAVAGFLVAFALLLVIANLLLASVAQRQRQRRHELERHHNRQARAGRRVQAALYDNAVRAREAAQHLGQFEAVGTFAGGIAHDMNNVLNILLGNVELLERAISPDNDLVREALEAVRSSGFRAASLLQRMTAVAGGAATETVICNVADEAQAAFSLMRGFRRDGTRLSCHADTSAQIASQAGQLSRAIINLAANALQATEHLADGAQVQVSVTDVRLDEQQAAHLSLPPGDYAEVRVSDNGKGMTPEQQERAFDPFVTGRSGEGGTGLGLFVVASIVEDLGGRIEVDSWLDRGTVVRLVLPVGERSRGRGAPTEAEASVHVLVVDDDEDSLNLLVEFVRALGYRPEGVRSGEEALLRCLADPEGWGAIITDGKMPGVNGVDLLLAVRGVADTPVLMVSGDPSLLQMARDEGAAVLPKPFTLADLGTALENTVVHPA